MVKILIYGTGFNAIKFVMQNGIDKILCFVEEKKDIVEFFQKPVLRLEFALSKYKGNKIVIASSGTVYFEIKEQLEKKGLKEFEDFIYWEIYQKKIALIYGNCHTVPIKEALVFSKKFNSLYGFYPLKQIQIMKKEATDDYDLPVFSRCDLLLHQSIRKDNIYGEEYASSNILSKAKASCKIIAIPNLYGLPKCFFPQVYSAPTICWEGENIFPFRDRYIDQLYSENIGLNDITKKLESVSLISRSEICWGWESFIEKVRLREKEWDIMMTDFLIDNYKDKQLFFNPNHPTNDVIRFITKKILRILQVNEKIDDEAYQALHSLDGYEIPIYNSVKSALSLQFDNKYLRKYDKRRLSGKLMDLEVYVTEYVMWNFLNNE